ncbi:MAG: tetratricopeptide repeat protein [Lachnospiraceae bacterium]|nr:tetratricopeptide repeat protein [Lachnospiraceae bacterium]
MDGMFGGNEEQFQMLLLALEDMKHGICLFQSEEQSRWAELIQKKLENREVILHNIAEDDEEAGMPMIADFKRWAWESDAEIVIVYNLQLLGLRFGDRKAVEHLNFMRDQIQHIGKPFLFGVSPYFDLLLSRNARDLYSCIRYHFKFTGTVAERGGIERAEYRERSGLGGDYALMIEKYWEYKKRAQDGTGEEQIRLYLECMDSWRHVRGNLPYQEKEDIRSMTDCVEKYYRDKQTDLSDVKQIWILADVWLELEEWTKGLYWHRLTIDRIREELGEDHKLYADALVHISDCYERTGDYEQCEKNYDRAIWIYEEEKAPLEGEYQDALIKRAVLFRRKSQFDQALEIYEKLLRYYTPKYGSGYIENATCFNNIGRVYHEQGDASAALEKYREALSLLLASGVRTPLLGILYHNIAIIYLENGDTKSAWKNIRLAKKETEKLYGKGSAELIGIYNLMAGIWNERGRTDRARECLEKALGIIRKTGVGETEQAAFVYHNMGHALVQERDPWKAISFLNRALELRLRIYGRLHVMTAGTYEGLGIAFYCLEEDKECRKNMKEAREIYVALYGEKNPRAMELERFMDGLTL